jgi:hypothetical protein
LIEVDTEEEDMRAVGRVAVAGILGGIATLGMATGAYASVGPAPALNGNAHLVHVGLNPASCGTAPGPKSGEVTVHSNAKLNRTQVDLSVRGAMPKTTYAVDIRCVAQIGTLTTNGSGNGTAHIRVSSALPSGSPFFVDISVPNGAGAGGYGDTFIAGPFTLGKKK